MRFRLAPWISELLVRPLIFLTALCVILLNSTSVQRAIGNQVASDRPIAFTNVNVISMHSDRVAPEQAVLIQGDRIRAVGKTSEITLPENVQRIDGTGKYLIPGLADMHLHLAPGAGDADDPAGRQMKLLLIHGVTTVRGMIGHEDHLQLRQRIETQEVIGPTLWCAGPPLLGHTVVSDEAASREVLQQKMQGFDFIKVHEGLQPEVYAAILETAARLDIPLAGHVTATVGLDRALKARQSSLEHLDGLLRQSVPADAPVAVPAGQFLFGPALQHVDSGLMAKWAGQIKEAGVRSTPTEALFERIASGAKAEDLLQLPEMKYVTPQQRAVFVKQMEGLANLKAPPADREKFIELRRTAIRQLHAAGVPLLAGSDAPQFFFVDGAALHDEVQTLAAAGLSPYAALAAATRNAGEYLAHVKDTNVQIGTIEVDKRADLVLLQANPLQDLENLATVDGVMVRGRWLSRELIDQLRAELTVSTTPAS